MNTRKVLSVIGSFAIILTMILGGCDGKTATESDITIILEYTTVQGKLEEEKNPIMITHYQNKENASANPFINNIKINGDDGDLQNVTLENHFSVICNDNSASVDCVILTVNDRSVETKSSYVKNVTFFSTVHQIQQETILCEILIKYGNEGQPKYTSRFFEIETNIYGKSGVRNFNA